MTWLTLSGLCAFVSLGGWLFYFLVLNQSEAPTVVRILTVTRGNVETTINASGTVELGGQQTLTSPVEGAVDEVLVQPGDRVQQRQILITLRNPERQTALANQQIQIDKQGVIVARARQQILEAREQLAVDQRQLQNLQILAEQGAIARTQFQDQEDRVRSAIVAIRTAEADARTAALELESLQLEKQRIQRQQQDTVITAPISGQVLGVNVKDGDGVQLRTNLLTLGNPVEEVVKLQLSTLDAALVRPGQPTRISVIGPTPTIFSGRITSLYPQAVSASSQEQGSTAGNTNESGQATVPTIVQLDTPSRTLIPGSQVNVEIVLDQRQNVITLSLEALQRSGSDAYVWIVDDEQKVQRRPITVGLEGLTSIEVLSGLQTGEQVALPSPDVPLIPGMLIEPEPEPTSQNPAIPNVQAIAPILFLQDR